MCTIRRKLQLPTIKSGRNQWRNEKKGRFASVVCLQFDVTITDNNQLAIANKWRPRECFFFFCCADTMHLPMDQSLCQRVDGVFSIRHEYCIVCGTPAQYNLPPIIDTHCERKHRRIAENIFVLSNPISFILVYSRCWAVWMWTF